MIADKGFDSDEFVRAIEAAGAEAVIPPRPNRKAPRDYDERLYRERNRVERFLSRARPHRRGATRYGKTARNFPAFRQFASIMILLP